MLTIVGEMADGWFPANPFTPEAYREKVEIIRRGAETARRNFSEIAVFARVYTVPNSDPSIRDEIKTSLKRMMIFHRSILKLLGAEEVIETLPKELEYQYISPNLEYAEKLRRAVDELQVPDDILDKGIDRMMAVGTADECISSLERFVKAGATHIDPFPIVGTKENYEVIAEKIIPHFRST